MIDKEKVRRWRESAGMIQEELSRLSGVSFSTIQRFESGKEIRYSNLMKIASYFGVTPSEFLAGPPTESQPDAEFVYIPYLNAADHPVSGEEIRIPHFSTRAGAGNGIAPEAEIKQHLSFRVDWIHRELRTNPGSLIIVDVSGDSMEPCFSDGDAVLVDTARRDPRKEGVYVFRAGDDLFIKRTQAQMGRILLKSDNPQYEPFFFDEASGKVIGRVVWKAGKVR